MGKILVDTNVLMNNPDVLDNGNYAEYKELRTDVSNGITLCKECHKEFHKTYGYSRNNEYQIKEFINDYKTKVS